MEIQVFESSNGDCPYLKNLEWVSYMFRADTLQSSVYEKMIDNGFRRSGHFFYKNNCPNCTECISIRIRVQDFKMSRSQKRIWKKNKELRIVQHPVEFDKEGFELYCRYCQWKHESETSEENYRDFLIATAVNTIMMRFYNGRDLAGIGWIDMLENSLSSVYFAFSPDYAKRSLGVYSALKEIELALQMKKTYLHMGFWVRDCQAMAYKSQYKPHQLLVDGFWMDSELDLTD
ncbi:MAG: arginyltransferase [Deltaproteobacteria bacterium]|nr:arginyltransferase [Deltaproteobacteria bacterium]